MQELTLHRHTETTAATAASDNSSSFLELPRTPACHRAVRIALPLPRRESCLTRRALLAALREAELAAWQSSGGDYLRSLQTV